MNTVMSYFLATSFIFSGFLLLAFFGQFVFEKLIKAAKLGMSYYDYRRFLARAKAGKAPDASEYWPVPVAMRAAMELEKMSSNGITICGVVLELEGKTFEVYSTGEKVHTGLTYKEGAAVERF